MTEDSVVRINGVTCTVRYFLKNGKLRMTQDGQYVTTSSTPQVPLEIHPEAALTNTQPIDPYSPKGLRIRGYHILPGKTGEEDRVLIDGGYYRISAARKHGLI